MPRSGRGRWLGRFRWEDHQYVSHRPLGPAQNGKNVCNIDVNICCQEGIT